MAEQAAVSKSRSVRSGARFRVKRVYDPPEREDRFRVLVDRLWPRGLTREAAAIHEWLREAAPSDELRKWFGHDPAKWASFKSKYFQELDGRPDVMARLLGLARSEVVTLLFAARDIERNNAVALREYLALRFSDASWGRAK